MFARTVTIDLDTELLDEAAAFGESVKDQIASFPGLLTWLLVVNRDTGQATSFSVFDSEEAFRAVNDQVNGILSDFGRFFVSPPNEILGDVLIQVGN